MGPKRILSVVIAFFFLIAVYTVAAAGELDVPRSQMDMPTETMQMEPVVITATLTLQYTATRPVPTLAPATPVPSLTPTRPVITMGPRMMQPFTTPMQPATTMGPGMRQSYMTPMPYMTPMFSTTGVYTSTMMSGAMSMGGCSMMGSGSGMSSGSSMGGMSGGMNMGSMGNMSMGSASGAMGNMNMSSSGSGFLISPADYEREAENDRSTALSNPWILLGWVLLVLVMLGVLAGFVIVIVWAIGRLRASPPAGAA